MKKSKITGAVKENTTLYKLDSGKTLKCLKVLPLGAVITRYGNKFQVTFRNGRSEMIVGASYV